jgi:hypothetical protein
MASFAPKIFVMEHLAMLFLSPDASSKICKIALIARASHTSRYAKRITSSAYRLHWYLIPSWVRLRSTPYSQVAANSRPRTSMTQMNNSRERESPCRTPYQCRIGLPGWPFNKMQDVTVESKVTIQRCQCVPKPIVCSTTSRNGHCTVSNAFATSSFRRIFGSFFLRKRIAARWTYLKLSWIVHPRMNAF